VKSFLTFIAMASWGAAAWIFIGAATVFHQLLAAILFLIGLVAIVGASVLSKQPAAEKPPEPTVVTKHLPKWVGLTALGVFIALFATFYVAIRWFSK
jgi:hypothetical protein